MQKFLEETGIVTFELLKTRCDSMGVIPPEESEFLAALGVGNEPRSVSSPAEGLIVLDPPEIVKESTGEVEHAQVENEVATTTPVAVEESSTQVKKKKKKPEVNTEPSENQS